MHHLTSQAQDTRRCGELKRLSWSLLAACLFMLAVFVPGCSFVLDFDECVTSADCSGFDQPAEGRFYTCSSSNKCVIDAERECRQDKHCGPSGDGRCDEEAGQCLAK